MKKNIKLSIVIVHYNNKKDLLECLNSFFKHKPKISFEVIVVDNSGTKDLSLVLSAKYKNIKYVPSGKNLGYGGGINFGVKFAIGKYIFVLNPDVVFEKDIFTRLVRNMEVNEKIGIIAPLLYSTNGKILDQGAREITPRMAIFKFSFIDKIFPQNPVSRNYWVKSWDKENLVEVDNVPGTAFIISKNLFNDIGGFDEKFFLYFEEFDICKRVRDLGYKIYIDPVSKLVHKWGTSTKGVENINTIFNQSRFYYFKKHFGFLKAFLLEFFLRINKFSIFLSFALFGGIVIRFHNLNLNVPFIGDQAWFFLSARDLLLSHQIPLVGITSSHVWLHQGPLWTYIVAILFALFKYNPLAPFYFTAACDSLVILALYFVVKNIFSQKAAAFAALLYAFSPAIIQNSRFAYHTSLIPLFTLLLFFSLFKWIKGNNKYFIFSIFLLAVLYNFELENVLFAFLFLLIFLYGAIKKTNWFNEIKNIKTAFFSILAFLIPMLPILIYDFKNGFKQTIVFIGWVGFKILPIHASSSTDYIGQLLYFYNFIQKLVFSQNGILSFVLIVFCVSVFLLQLIRNKTTQNTLLFLIFAFISAGVFFSNTQSDAYLPSLYVPLILVTSIAFAKVASSSWRFLILIFFIFLISIFNFYFLTLNNYFIGNGYGPSIADRIQVAKYIIKEAKNYQYKIVGIGPGSQFDSFTDNYKYLGWYLGKEPSYNNSKVLFIVSESESGIKILKK